MGQGREAVTVRQFILVILLVSAAFLGGAFVNGPGLQWAQSRILRLLGLTNNGEIAAVDLEPSSNGEIGPEPAEPVAKPADIPPNAITPTPSIASENKPFKRHPSNKASPLQLEPESTKNDLSLDQSGPSFLGSATSPHSVTKSSSDTLASPDAAVKLAGGDSRPPSSRGSMMPPNGATSTPQFVNGLAALLPPSGNSLPDLGSPEAPSSAGRKSTRVVEDEWVLLESRMQTLGVTRFTIEGKPGGPIVFACLIPVAGRQAVAERFEAEGDDVIHAAQSVLRRIVLWRATQTPHSE
jgi:hypothetical protein